jgi:transglutaminase-like putative cysteine protease
MFNPLFLRSISQLVLLTFTSLTLQPLQAAVMAEQHKQAALTASQAPAPISGDERYGKALDSMRDLLERAEKKQTRGERDDDEVQQLRSQKRELDAMESEVEADFIATGQHLKEAHLPAEIIARHQAAVKEFQLKQSELKQKLKAVEEADDAKDQTKRSLKIRELADFMKANQHQKTHTPTDPNKLPFSTPSSKVRAPIQTEKGYQASLFKPNPLTRMLAGPIPNGFTLPSTTLPLTPTAADLAPTEDLVLTPAIQALATSLNNNPVKIYNWVRNNIEFLPTYGSIQGADMTLQTKRGNSFDTASLLIAIFRAAKIPARYVYGTIQVPADQAMNWVGGVTKPEAAQQLMGQGGIPNIGLVAGGQIKFIKLEHVWVEAFVDYVPSRGAVNRVGDTWIPLDASFKQYTYAQGMDIKTAVPFDAQALATQAQAGATVDPSGWVQNINSTAIQSALTSYQTEVQSYINTTKTNATVGDVIGAKTIIPRNDAILLGTLPYKTVATGGKFTVLPDQVRHKFQYNLYASALDRALDSPTISLQQSLPSLAGKKITLSFAPATQADADLIASYSSSTTTSLPGYLIHLTAEMRVDGQVVAMGGTFTMGDDLIASEGLYDPGRGGWDFADDTSPVAGEYIATHVDLQGVSAGQLQALKARLVQTQAKLSAGQSAGMTKEDITGDILYTAVLSYFADNQAASQLAQRAIGMVEYRKPSFGNFLVSTKTLYWFGIPKVVSFPGLMMDIQRYASINVAKDNNPATAIAYNKQCGGRLSAYEHFIPEKLFTSPASPGQGISAIKALSVANAQGQKIYAINVQNAATVLPQLIISPEVQIEIQNAIAAGKEATVSQGNITIGGWTGVGYIITDPTTGAGAYKISGGANGGGIFGSFMDNVAPFLGLYGLGLGLLALVPALAAVASTLALLSLLISITLAIDSLILYWMTADPATCGEGRDKLFAVPIALSLSGLFEFIKQPVVVALYAGALVADGAINNTCLKGAP